MPETGDPYAGPTGSQAPHAGGANPGGGVRSRTAGLTDAPVAARLHVEQISQGFLALLGPGFLTRLYRRVCLDPHSFLIMATRGSGDEGVVGFVAGSTNVPALYRSFVWRDGVMAALPTLGHLVTHWRRVLETLRHGSSGSEGTGRGAELLSIAVDRGAQGQGTGRALVRAFLDELARRGVEAAHVVVGADNRGAVALYEGAGFVTVERFELHPGTESLLMQWDRTMPTTNPAATGDEGR
jgi:ribosomal protein S18 acetylase RimI-like enzyme